MRTFFESSYNFAQNYLCPTGSRSCGWDRHRCSAGCIWRWSSACRCTLRDSFARDGPVAQPTTNVAVNHKHIIINHESSTARYTAYKSLRRCPMPIDHVRVNLLFNSSWIPAIREKAASHASYSSVLLHVTETQWWQYCTYGVLVSVKWQK